MRDASLRLVTQRTVCVGLRCSMIFTTSPWLFVLQADTAQTYRPMSTSCRQSGNDSVMDRLLGNITFNHFILKPNVCGSPFRYLCVEESQFEGVGLDPGQRQRAALQPVGVHRSWQQVAVAVQGADDLCGLRSLPCTYR